MLSSSSTFCLLFALFFVFFFFFNDTATTEIYTLSLHDALPIARTLGNCLSMSSLSRLTALIGPARVKDLIFTARLVGAEEAASVGLLNEVVDDLSALQRRVEELATLIAGN